MPEVEDMETKERRRSTTELWLPRNVLIICMAAAAVVSLLISFPTVLVVESQSNDRIRANAVNMCDGSNLLRGFALIATQAREGSPSRNLAQDLLKIRDCEASYDAGRIIAVDEHVEREYLKALMERRRVAIRDGGRRLEVMP
jgi:hypothetical protein